MSILLSLPLQITGPFGLGGFAETLELIVAGFAFVLLLISLTAYSRTKSRKLLLVSGAFVVVLVRVLLVENSALLFPFLSLDVVGLVRSVLDLTMLLLFFLAVIKS
ncbi:MAG: hypothetical protein JRM82_00305 [Nitrososphaerota archaeon]|nr:hypothetical protein [Nitrososphaerota archaeon]